MALSWSGPAAGIPRDSRSTFCTIRCCHQIPARPQSRPPVARSPTPYAQWVDCRRETWIVTAHPAVSTQTTQGPCDGHVAWVASAEVLCYPSARPAAEGPKAPIPGLPESTTVDSVPGSAPSSLSISVFRKSWPILPGEPDKTALIAHRFQLNLAPENPIDTRRIGQDDRHSHASDNQHNAQCFLR